MPENPERPLETGEPVPASRETSSDPVGGRSKKSEILSRLVPFAILTVSLVIQTIATHKYRQIAIDALDAAHKWQNLYEGKVAAQDTLSRCATIHKPATGCPAGYREVPDMFEKDGKKSAACTPVNRCGWC